MRRLSVCSCVCVFVNEIYKRLMIETKNYLRDDDMIQLSLFCIKLNDCIHTHATSINKYKNKNILYTTNLEYKE